MLNVRDRVVLISNIHGIGDRNPYIYNREYKNVTGVIVQIYGSEFRYSVEWSNRHNNVYREGELMLLKEYLKEYLDIVIVKKRNFLRKMFKELNENFKTVKEELKILVNDRKSYEKV